MDKQRLAIVRGERITNKSGKGRPSYAQMKGLMNYIAYGRYADHLGQEMKQRGVWLDHHGRAVSHEEMLHWAKEKVHQYGHEYTYQLLLSTRYGELSADDFNDVLQQGSELSGVREWRTMIHEDTQYQHAHVLLLRREKLSNALYREWQQRMQAALEQLQMERHQERQAEIDLSLSAEVAPDHSRSLEQAQGKNLEQAAEVKWAEDWGLEL
ncbi:MAG: hypothetical protein ACE5E7_19605 [Anaerolineae bacterium]